MAADTVEILERLIELIEIHPEKPVYVEVVGGAHGWIVGVENREDGPTLVVETL